MDKFISCDWGTSAFRLRLVKAATNTVVSEVKIEQGIASTYKLWTNSKIVNDRFSFYRSVLDKYIAMLEQTVYKDTAETLEETELAVIPKEDFEELINKNAQVTQKFIRLLAKNVSSREEHLLSLAYSSLRKKVAEALLLLKKKYQKNNKNTY